MIQNVLIIVILFSRQKYVHEGESKISKTVDLETYTMFCKSQHSRSFPTDAELAGHQVDKTLSVDFLQKPSSQHQASCEDQACIVCSFEDELSKIGYYDRKLARRINFSQHRTKSSLQTDETKRQNKEILFLYDNDVQVTVTTAQPTIETSLSDSAIMTSHSQTHKTIQSLSDSGITFKEPKSKSKDIVASNSHKYAKFSSFKLQNTLRNTRSCKRSKEIIQQSKRNCDKRRILTNANIIRSTSEGDISLFEPGDKSKDKNCKLRSVSCAGLFKSCSSSHLSCGNSLRNVNLPALSSEIQPSAGESQSHTAEITKSNFDSRMLLPTGESSSIGFSSSSHVYNVESCPPCLSEGHTEQMLEWESAKKKQQQNSRGTGSQQLVENVSLDSVEFLMENSPFEADTSTRIGTSELRLDLSLGMDNSVSQYEYEVSNATSLEQHFCEGSDFSLGSDEPNSPRGRNCENKQQGNENNDESEQKKLFSKVPSIVSESPLCYKTLVRDWLMKTITPEAGDSKTSLPSSCDGSMLDDCLFFDDDKEEDDNTQLTEIKKQPQSNLSKGSNPKAEKQTSVSCQTKTPQKLVPRGKRCAARFPEREESNELKPKQSKEPIKQTLVSFDDISKPKSDSYRPISQTGYSQGLQKGGLTSRKSSSQFSNLNFNNDRNSSVSKDSVAVTCNSIEPPNSWQAVVSASVEIPKSVPKYQSYLNSKDIVLEETTYDFQPPENKANRLLKGGSFIVTGINPKPVQSATQTCPLPSPVSTASDRFKPLSPMRSNQKPNAARKLSLSPYKILPSVKEKINETEKEEDHI